MFREHVKFHDTNRKIANDSTVKQVELANGEIGVLIQWGTYPICVTNDEAITLATGLVNTVEVNRK